MNCSQFRTGQVPYLDDLRCELPRDYLVEVAAMSLVVPAECRGDPRGRDFAHALGAVSDAGQSIGRQSVRARRRLASVCCCCSGARGTRTG